MNYWLMKTEPEVFSIDDLEERGAEPWSGVRNYQARNFMRDGMRPGDGVLLYHSNCAEVGIAGLAKVGTMAYADPTQFDPANEYFDPKSTRENPRWLLVDVAFVERFPRILPLAWMRAQPFLTHLACLQKGNRLSITPVDAAAWKILVARGRAATPGEGGA